MQQQMLQKEQMEQSAAASKAALDEQQREFDTSQKNREQDLADTKKQQDTQAAEIARQAALTQQWQTGRANEAANARQSIDDAFAQFTPDYYNKYTQAYRDNYTPEVDRQYGLAKQNLAFGLARQGITQSQAAATQQGLLAQDRGRQTADISNKAVDATTGLQNSVQNAKSGFLNTALSDQTLGSPITPGSADAIGSAFDQTSRALSQVRSSAGDVVGTLAAPPSYNALGNLFGSAASGVANYVAGSQFNEAYGSGGGVRAASPTAGGSSRVV